MSDLTEKCFRALIFDEEEEYESAIEELTSLIESSSQLVIAHNNRGVAYQEIGRIAEAESDFRKACDISSRGNATPLLNLAGILKRKGDLQEALKFAEAAIVAKDTNDSAKVVRDQIHSQYEERS